MNAANKVNLAGTADISVIRAAKSGLSRSPARISAKLIIDTAAGTNHTPMCGELNCIDTAEMLSCGGHEGWPWYCRRHRW